MSELKACPFCGGRIIHTPSGESGYICHHCGTERFGEWNTRPIEDALLSRAEKAEEEVEQWENVAAMLADELNDANSERFPLSWEDASESSPAWIAYVNLRDRRQE